MYIHVLHSPSLQLLQLQQQLDLERTARHNLEKDIEQLKRQKELLQEEFSGRVEKG